MMLPKKPDIKDLRDISVEYRKVLLSSMELIAERDERDSAYPWISYRIVIYRLSGDD